MSRALQEDETSDSPVGLSEGRGSEAADEFEDLSSPPRRGAAVTWGIALVIVVALFALGALTSQSEVDPAAGTAVPLPVTAIVPALEPSYTVERSYVGRIEASRSSQLGFELGGLLTVVRVDEGDIVRRGELLAELDTDRLKARKRSLEARLKEAQANATLAALTRGRVNEAQDLDAVSPQALDEAELGLAASQAALEQARSALEEIEVELRKSRLLAPYEAVIAGRFVDEGQVLSAGTPVLDILERGRPQARIGIAGDAIATLEKGQAHDVKVGDRKIPATILAILPMRRAGTRSIEVLLELDSELVSADTPDGVHEGDLARLEIGQRLESAGFWLPKSALTESSRGLWAVYAIEGEGSEATVERRELEILYQEADRVFARGTLQDGEHIVASGLHRLVPGQRVEVRSEESRSEPLTESGAG